MYYYKIKRVTDGRYSTGGVDPKFSTVGKAWKSIGYLKCHLKQFEYTGIWPYNNCIIVRVQLLPDEFLLDLNDKNSNQVIKSLSDADKL